MELATGEVLNYEVVGQTASRVLFELVGAEDWHESLKRGRFGKRRNANGEWEICRCLTRRYWGNGLFAWIIEHPHDCCQGRYPLYCPRAWRLMRSGLGAREHNLKNLSLAIPRDQLVVVTGLSGSEIIAGL